MTWRRRSHGGASNGPGILGRVGGSLFFLFFLAMGLLAAGLLGREVLDQIGTRSWPSTDCRIVSSEVAMASSHTHKPYRLRVHYRYSVGSAEYESTAYRRAYEGSADREPIEALVSRFSPGSSAVCFYDPDDPDDAVLAHVGIPWMAFFLLIPLVFIVIGAGGIIFIWQRGSASGPRPISAAADRSRKSTLAVAVLVFALILGGSAGTYFLLVRPVGRVIAARGWSQVPCRIISSQVGRHDSDDGTTYSIDIYYEYEFGGQTYRSGRYGFMGGSSSGYDGKAEVVRQFPEGSMKVCWVNPDRPDLAVINRDFQWLMLIGLFPLVLALVGVGGMTAIGRKSLGSAGPAAAGSPYTRRHGPRTSAARQYESAGRMVMQSRSSPWAKLIGMTFFALFWNGILSVFLVQLVEGWKRGQMEIFLTIFLIPFVLVGLLLISGIVYAFLGLFNPRPRLELDRTRVALGQTARLTWNIANPRRLRRLSLILEGREEATYRRGTDTHTDRSVFCRQVLFETENWRDMLIGGAELTVPADSMHTFVADNNRILWRIEVAGDIRRWPDLDESFELHVEPRGGEASL